MPIHIGTEVDFAVIVLADQVDRVLALNSVSLVCGVVGNIFLLFNFTQSVRYIIALPVTIITWFLATAIVGILHPGS